MTPPSPLTPDAQGTSSLRKIAVTLLLIVGASLWLTVGDAVCGAPWQVALYATTTLLCLLPPVHRPIFRFLEKLRDPSPCARRWTTLAVMLLTAAYLAFTTLYHHRDLTVHWEDEQSYMIQMQMLVRGRLWMPPLPLADFFDTFYLLVRPKYASMYFPGAALLYAPILWLHLPVWLAPLAASSALIGLCYRLIAEFFDGLFGLLAVPLVIAGHMFRLMSVMVLSHIPVILLALLAIWAYLHWRRQHAPPWALAIGAFLGWAAITRPLDALCFALPVGLAMFLDARQGAGPSQGTGPSPARNFPSTSAALLLAASPFLLLQLLCNLGITGHPLLLPYTLLEQHDFPGSLPGSHDPAAASLSSNPRKQDYYTHSVAPDIRAYQSRTPFNLWLIPPDCRLDRIRDADLPDPLLLLFVPASLLSLMQRRRWVLWGMVPLMALIFTFHAFFPPHYAVICAPAIALIVLAGVYTVESTWPRACAVLSVLLSLLILEICITALPEFKRPANPLGFHAPLLHQVEIDLDRLPQAPAVVLFRYSPLTSKDEEPVYNTSVAWPDDALIIRAHDLGPRNVDIFRYYASLRGPDRTFYRYDEATMKLTRLGAASDLAAHPTPEALQP